MNCLSYEGGPHPADEMVVFGALPLGPMCMAHLDRFMFQLSLSEGRAGYVSFRAEKGLPFPANWPEYEPLP